MCTSCDAQFVPAHKQQGLTTLPMCAHHKFYPSEKGPHQVNPPMQWVCPPWSKAGMNTWSTRQKTWQVGG